MNTLASMRMRRVVAHPSVHYLTLFDLPPHTDGDNTTGFGAAAGLALQQKGHPIHFYTSHHDPDHCFVETRDGTFGVTVYGDWYVVASVPVPV